jgi:dolichyl-phosphate-mannose-protein mannosyltransferase
MQVTKRRLLIIGFVGFALALAGSVIFPGTILTLEQTPTLSLVVLVLFGAAALVSGLGVFGPTQSNRYAGLAVPILSMVSAFAFTSAISSWYLEQRIDFGNVHNTSHVPELITAIVIGSVAYLAAATVYGFAATAARVPLGTRVRLLVLLLLCVIPLANVIGTIGFIVADLARTNDERDGAAGNLTLLDRLWEGIATTPARARVLRWVGPVGVTLIAAGTRLWNLGSPRALVFDESYYVKDAYTLSKLGYEGLWPHGASADPGFAAGHVNTFLPTASFVVHPPLGKWIISIGLDAFGVGNSFSWRIMTAIVGILAVVLVMVLAKYLFKSTLVATIAGLLMAIDGQAIVLSRVSLLDNFVMFVALLGFGGVLLDRAWSAERLSTWIAKRSAAGKGIGWGPDLWWRPWLIVAGLLFGLDTAIKWNGIYFLAGFAIYTLIVDAIARRRAGLSLWLPGTILRQAPTTFVLMIPIALAGYLASWTGWFVTKGGLFRNYADQAGHAWTGILAWVPHSLQSLWHYQSIVYLYNVSESVPHSYAANPLTWLLMIRPTSMYYQSATYTQHGCTVPVCGSEITDIANPLIWYAGVAAAIYLLYRLIRYREWRVGMLLTGIALGYLPWLLYLNRTVFQYYTIVFEPYMILGLAFVASLLIGTRDDPLAHRRRGQRLVAIFIAIAVILSVYFWPIWTGTQTSYGYLASHWWLPTWR